MNLVDLIEADGVKLKKYGTTYRGKCPFHDGKTETSLLVDADAGEYFCFGCNAHGDEIQWLRDWRGFSFIEACKYLGRDPGPRSNGHRPAVWEPKEAKTPGDVWQGKARAFHDEAVSCLWANEGELMRAWLCEQKGLHDATIQAANLGLNLADKYEPREAWGLEPVIKEDGTERKQWIPAGLVIPLIVDGTVHRLRIRRSDPGDGARYVAVSGSGMGPMLWGEEKGAFVIVESELDGLLLWQDAGDLIGVVALGSAQAKPDGVTDRVLKQAAVILVSLDSDTAGAAAAWRFWLDTYNGKAKRWPTVRGKDPSEARANGLDLWLWIKAGLFRNEQQFERFAIQTVDGKLSDYEAFKAF